MDASVSANIRIASIYKIFFVCFVACGLYYPSIFSEFNSIDDATLISYLEETDFNFLDIIMPGKSHYYRPVVWFTFFFDKYVWGLEPSFMHLGNIIIHTGNAVLVYMLSSKVCESEEKRLELPLLMALLFAAHPINTEAVCWVAGRTDPLATLFILTAAYYLADSLPENKFPRQLLPAGFIFLGCLSKEVAFFFFPPAYLSTLRYTIFAEKGRFSWSGLLRPAIPFLFFSLLYLYLRQIALDAEDKSFSILLTQNTSYSEGAVAAFKAFGFYVKKLFVPLPLNFAIVSIHNSYIWLGGCVLILFCWMLFQKRRYYYFFCCSLFLILPAVMIAVKRVAWTPVAERYLYAPAAFFVIAFTGMLYYLLSKRKCEYLLPFFLVVTIIVSAILTVQRNLVWQDNYLLYKDAVAQSPQFAKVRNEYGVALLARGDKAEAIRQFEVTKSIELIYQLPVLNLANIKFKEGKIDEALKMLADTYKNKSAAQTKVLKLEARIYEHLLFGSKNTTEQKEIALELIDNYHYIYLQDHDPYIPYRSGQLLLFVNKPQEAGLLFEAAYKDAPDDAFYKMAAKKLADKFRKK